MKVLAFDLGRSRTGVAFLETAIGVPLASDTLTHGSDEECIARLEEQIALRGADLIVLGLPLLPSSAEGEQASHVRRIGDALAARGHRVVYHDERYTTPAKAEHDGDAAAACQLLLSFPDSRLREDVDKPKN